MTRSTMRALLRRQVQEATADQWSDVDLNEALNVGLLMAEKEILKIDKLAFAYMYAIDLVGAKDNYPLPTAFMFEHSVEMLVSGQYKRIPRLDYIDRENHSGSDYRYSILGRYLFLKPAPTSSVTSGMRLLFCPVLTMAEDTDTPEVDDSLHVAIVAAAKILLMEDTAESAESARRRLAESVADLPLYRGPSVPEYVSIDGINSNM